MLLIVLKVLSPERIPAFPESSLNANSWFTNSIISLYAVVKSLTLPFILVCISGYGDVHG